LICLVLALAILAQHIPSVAADITFNITKIAEASPFPPATGSSFSYADVWSENGYVYLGSDRGFSGTGQITNGPQGISIFSISNAGVPTFLPPMGSPPAGFVATTYFGNEMEDVEVYDGIGYFSSDVNGSSGRTGVDIVDLSIPFDPIMLSRVDTSDCLSRSPTVCAHGKVHTLSIQRFNANTPIETRYMYTSDNETDTVKVTNVSNPESPALVASIDLGLASNVGSHEVVVRNNRLYIASKLCPGCSGSASGTVHIYDVSTPTVPVLLKSFVSGTSTHTAMPTEDGKYLVVAEERSNGDVKIYDISNINSPSDPDTPVLLKTLNRSNVCRNGTCLDAHSPHHVHIFGNLMFMPWYEAGLTVFNISDPSNPKWVGAYDSYAGTSTNFNGDWGVDLSRGLKQVLISDRTRGLIVLDASGVVLPGDYNQDMSVTDLDYDVWRSSYDKTRSSVHDLALADGNYDGIVDAKDYVIWKQHYGEVQTGYPVGSAAAVPEPTAFLLTGMCVLLTNPRRHRPARSWFRENSA